MVQSSLEGRNDSINVYMDNNFDQVTNTDKSINGIHNLGDKEELDVRKKLLESIVERGVINGVDYYDFDFLMAG